jgi:hypothetical protein
MYAATGIDKLKKGKLNHFITPGDSFKAPADFLFSRVIAAYALSGLSSGGLHL